LGYFFFFTPIALLQLFDFGFLALPYHVDFVVHLSHLFFQCVSSRLDSIYGSFHGLLPRVILSLLGY
jgi:hypothetical protein